MRTSPSGPSARWSSGNLTDREQSQVHRALVGYCMMIEIAQMALLELLANKLQTWTIGPEGAARARGAICRTVKSVQMIRSAKRALKLVSESKLNAVLHERV